MSSVSTMITSLGDYGFADVSSTRLVEKINETIWDIASREPWPFLEKELALNFDGSSATPSNAPTDLGAVLKITNVSTGQRLVPVRLDDLEDAYATMISQIGTPLVYYFLANTLKTVPISSSGTGTWRLKYLCIPVAVTSSTAEVDIIIPARHHEAIMLGTLMRLFNMEDDVEMSSRFQGMYEKKIMDMRQDLWRKHYDGPDYIHQSEDYDYYYCG